MLSIKQFSMLLGATIITQPAVSSAAPTDGTVTSIYIPDSTGQPLAANLAASIITANSLSQHLALTCTSDSLDSIKPPCSLPAPFTLTVGANSAHYTAGATTLDATVAPGNGALVSGVVDGAQFLANVGGVVFSNVTITAGADMIVPLVTMLAETSESGQVSRAPSTGGPGSTQAPASRTSSALAPELTGVLGLGGVMGAVAVVVGAL